MKRERKKQNNVKTEAVTKPEVKSEGASSEVSGKKPVDKKKIWIIAASVIGALVIVAFITLAALNPGSCIAKGVMAGGVNIGGKTVEEAKTALAASDALKGKEFVVKDTVSGKQATISADSISFGYDVDKMIDEAYKIGRGKGLFGDATALLKLQFSHIDVSESYTYDEEALKKALYDFGVSVNGKLKNYELEFGDGTVTVKRGERGQSKDVAALQEAFLTAVQSGESEIPLNLEIKDPPEPDVQGIYDEIYTAPTDATYTVTNGKMTVTPGKAGRSIDKAEAEAQIEAIKSGGTATLKIVSIAPTVTEETLTAELFGAVLGRYSTSYSTSSQNRSSNVELAASKIDGTVLMPDEVFSYNDTVGQRTSANGFKSAPVFENGETVQGMGGGVCQVSSTLYSAVLYADLPVIERQNHSLTVSYVPKGQDATVAYDSIDFKFKNDTKGPIKISAKTAGKTIEISIWGAKPAKEKKVEVVSSVTQTISPSVQEVNEPNMASGTRKVISNGKTGFVVSTVRKVYEDGVLVKTETMPTSRYKMTPTKVAVGTATTAVFNDESDDKPDDSTQPAETGDTQGNNAPAPSDDKPDTSDNKPQEQTQPSEQTNEGTGVSRRPSENAETEVTE